MLIRLIGDFTPNRPVNALRIARSGPMEVQYLLRQGVMRMEMNRGEAAAVMIVDPTAKTSYMLMPQRRMYMVMPLVHGAGAETQRTAPEVVRTGRKEKIEADQPDEDDKRQR